MEIPLAVCKLHKDIYPFLYGRTFSLVHNLRTYGMTPGFKTFTVLQIFLQKVSTLKRH